MQPRNGRRPSARSFIEQHASRGDDRIDANARAGIQIAFQFAAAKFAGHNAKSSSSESAVVLTQTFDLSSHHAAALPLINRAVHAMKAQVGSADQFDTIFLVGGGCKIFEPLIQQAFPNHSVHIADDPVFANVRGFHTIGELLIRRKAAA